MTVLLLKLSLINYATAYFPIMAYKGTEPACRLFKTV